MNFFKKSFAIVFASVFSLCTCFATPPGSENPDYEFKVILLGDYKVGKKNIISSVVRNCSPENHPPTIGTTCSTVNFKLKNGKYARLNMWDTAGQERFRSFVPLYLRDSQCVLLVFDVTSRPSFNNIPRWVELLRNNVDQDLPQIAISVVGNKIDLPGRTVSSEEGMGLANSLNARYYEVSTLTRQGIHEALMGTVDEAVEKYNIKHPVVKPLRFEDTAEKARCC